MCDVTIRAAETGDVSELHSLEQRSFETDRLSKKRIKHWVKAPNGIFLVAELSDGIVGYGLVILRNGTRLARLYSIAIDRQAWGQGIAHRLLHSLEEHALDRGRLYMRLEVAENNDSAIRLYEKNGYAAFGVYANYYEHNINAIRMQKPIRQLQKRTQLPTYPWYRQTTEFTCGPSALLMAMHHLNRAVEMSQQAELRIWREATTIFMTSGHGGSHPYGLALAAARRGFMATVYVSVATDLFVDGVRQMQKKHIMNVVEQDFIEQIQASPNINVVIGSPSFELLQQQFVPNTAVLGLISTYRLHGIKAPHWVCITQMDNECFYLHDPDVDNPDDNPLEYQHIPIVHNDFMRMAGFGKQRLSAFIVIQNV